MPDERLDELFRLIVRGEHPAVSADRRWRRLLTTWQVFEGNFAELIELVGAYEEDPRVHMRVMYEPPVGDLEYRERFFDELTRRWHNYVGSAMTYLDHERVFIAQESEGSQRLSEHGTQPRWRCRRRSTSLASYETSSCMWGGPRVRLR